MEEAMLSRRVASQQILRTVLFVGLVLMAGAAPAADRIPVWVPSTLAPVGIERTSDLYYAGASGLLVGADPQVAADLEAAGAIPVMLNEGESLYMFLVEDATRAALEPPARAIAGSGRELLVVTNGDAPRLTEPASSAMRGLRQPVRIPMRPIAWPDLAPPPQGEPSRDIDPLVQSMLNALTQGNYVASWQMLDDFETRYYNTTGNNNATQWLLDQFRAMGLSADFHYYTYNGAQRRNVIATLPGQVDPTKVIYICGHLDATSDTPSSCAPGADDNGSGTAAVLEAARVMKDYLFQYTIKFACFNGEEQGLIGSDAYCATIAGQGEDVIAAFNCDMVAYRGNDAAPPDLVVYTNTASLPLSTTMTNVISTYLPGQLTPVVINDGSMTGSDHSSFWSRGWKAVCSIEDEAWGDDFCPWYHTCNDRIERYPQDYCCVVTRANIAAVATTAVPINPTGPYLVYGSSTLDDDTSGGSNGNGDGVVNPGETCDLYVTVRNVGGAAATHVHGTLSTTNPNITIVTPNANWSDIPAGGQGANLTGMRFQANGTLTDGEVIPFTLTMVDDSGSKQLAVQFTAAAPKLAHYFHTVGDLSSGNGNGIIDPGEVVLVPVTLSNRGAQSAADVQAILTSGSADLIVLDGMATVALIASGGQAELSPAYRVVVSGSAPAGEMLTLNLAISAGAGYQASSSFRLKVGTAVYDDCEADGPWRLADNDDTAATGRWVRVDPNGTTYNGQPAQTEDDHTPAPGTDCFVTGQGTVGGTAGEADLDGGKTTLTTPTFDLTHVTNPTLAYWRWYTNNLGNNPNEDTWVVQVSSDGGTSWVDLERTTSSANAWTEKTFLLTSYITLTNQVVVRFVASDLVNNSLLEAAVDDVEINGAIQPMGADDAAQPRLLRLDPARPSPTAGGTAISFATPDAGPVMLRVYGVDGRLVRTLVDGTVGAGEHRLAWDGRLESGKMAVPGVYFLKLQAEGKQITQRIAIVR
jgi:hypothetical protein